MLNVVFIASVVHRLELEVFEDAALALDTAVLFICNAFNSHSSLFHLTLLSNSHQAQPLPENRIVGGFNYVNKCY